MLRLDISASPTRPVTVVGESLLVRTTVRNVGDRPAEVPVLSDVDYVVKRDGADEIVLSLRAHSVALSRGERMPPMPSQTRTLAPGALSESEEDIAQYALGRLLPGSYRGQARLRLGDDTFVGLFAFKVEPPRATHAVVAMQEGGTIVAAQEEAGEKGSAVIVRHAMSGHPCDGSGTRLIEDVRPTSLAVTLNVASPDHQAWVAFVDEAGTIVALRSGARRALGWAQSPALAVASPRLVSPGFMRSDGILFAAVGTHRGAAAVQLATLAMSPGDTAVLGPKYDAAIQLADPTPFAPALADEVLPVLDGDGSSPNERSERGEQALRLVWCEAEGAASRVCSARIDASVAETQPAVLFETREPLLRLVAPAWRRNDPAITALFGERPAKPLELVRIGFDGGAARTRIAIAPPSEAVDAWGLSADEDYVIARIGRRLFVRGPGYADWTFVAEVADGARDLRVVTIHGRERWTQWFDSLGGLRHARLP